MISHIRCLARNKQRSPVNYVPRVTRGNFIHSERLCTIHILALSELFEIRWRLFNSLLASFTFQIWCWPSVWCLTWLFHSGMSVLNCVHPSYRGHCRWLSKHHEGAVVVVTAGWGRKSYQSNLLPKCVICVNTFNATGNLLAIFDSDHLNMLISHFVYWQKIYVLWLHIC